jgi:hypothetical protein
MKAEIQKDKSLDEPATPALRLTSRRSVIKQLAAIGLSVPVILTLTPSEARAQGSGGS